MKHLPHLTVCILFGGACVAAALWTDPTDSVKIVMERRTKDPNMMTSTTDNPHRRAMRVPVRSSGALVQVGIYHDGGDGKMVLAIYKDENGQPGQQLARTDAVDVAAQAGWQYERLRIPVNVLAGRWIWIAWVFQNNPGIRYEAGQYPRADSGQDWSGGMPTTFGPASLSNYSYMIDAIYGDLAIPTDEFYETYFQAKVNDAVLKAMNKHRQEEWQLIQKTIDAKIAEFRSTMLQDLASEIERRRTQ